MRIVFRLDIFVAVLVTAMTVAGFAWSAEERAPGVWRDDQTGLAIGGFDPVGYYTRGRPVPGRHAVGWRYAGAGWQFENDGNRSAFARDPDVYAPRYFGFDPVSVAAGKPIAGQPVLYRIKDKRLYLFASDANRIRFDHDTGVMLTGADSRWEGLAPNLENVRDR